MSNKDKLFKLIAELTELDDPRIRINVNVGMQLTEWVNKTAKIIEGSDEWNAGFDAGFTERGYNDYGPTEPRPEKESHDLRRILDKVPGAKVSGDISE